MPPHKGNKNFREWNGFLLLFANLANFLYLCVKLYSNMPQTLKNIETNGEIVFYQPDDSLSLDAILSVGYRVSSCNATLFRRWATAVLKDYLPLRTFNQGYGKKTYSHNAYGYASRNDS